MSLLDNVQNIAFASSIPTDLILGTYTGSISVAAPTATTYSQKQSASATVATGIPERTFFQGVFSTNNGSTWVDFNSNVPVTLGSFANLQTQMMYACSKPNSIVINVDNWNKTADGINYTASAYMFLYKIVLFAKPGQGDIIPQPVTQQQNFTSFTNYQKIFKDSIYNFTLPVGTSTSTITHNLGYIPKLRSYIENFSYADDTAAIYDFGYFVSQYVAFQAYMDTTTIKYFVNNGGISPMTGTLYTRIYYDA